MGMENIKYYKDLNHNYLIIKDEAGEGRNGYQHKMITANRMKRLLACKIRYVNQECHFYYEISSKQSLTGLFDKRNMDYLQLRRMFECMKEALTELDHYLLNSRCLILLPEYIFGNPETEEYFFLYYPQDAQEGREEKEEMKGMQMSLVEFLVEKVEPEQEEAVNAVYKIYELVQDHGFILGEILGLFQEKVPEIKEKVEEIIYREEEREDIPWNAEDVLMECKNGNENDMDAPKHLITAGILAFVCMTAAAGVFVLRYFFLLSTEEALLSMAGSVVLMLLSAFLLLYVAFNIYGRKRYERHERHERRERHGEEGRGREEKETVPEADPYPVSQYAQTGIYDKTPIYGDPGKKESHPYHVSGETAEDVEYGNTVFLEAAVCKTEHKLYGTNKGNKYHINLERLPCTVGKMAGSVDVVIRDNTVSRIHARFTKQEEGICVTDMNSTNGTFKNGLRLEPNETVVVEQGDELRFGRMTFCYR